MKGKVIDRSAHVAERMRNMLQPIATYLGIKDDERIPKDMMDDCENKANEALKEIVEFLEDY